MSISIVIETIQQVATSATPLLVAYLGFKGKFRFDDVSKKLIELERINKREHREITDSIEFINARDSLTKGLTKVCNSSISYTTGEYELNAFKTSFTNAIIGLSMSTLNSGFKWINTDIFHGYMDVAEAKIKTSYSSFDKEIIDYMQVHIKESADSYYDGMCDIIEDDVFNDKHDRFVDLTIAFLRNELMIITKHWWRYNNN